jgi:TldD protein
MYEDLADFSIGFLQKKGVDYAEARLETTTSTGMVLKDSNPEITGFDQSSGLGVRYLFKKNMGFISINDLEKRKIHDQLENSLRITEKASKISEPFELAHHKGIKKKNKVTQKQNIADFSQEEKLKILKELDKTLKCEHKYITLSDDINEKYYVNTEGSQISSTIPRINFMYFLTLIEGDKSIQRYQQKGAASGYEALKTWNLSSEIQKEIEALRSNLKNAVAPPKNKEIDIVTAPEVTGIAVHEACGHPTEADRIFGREAAQAGESFVEEGMIGSKIGSENVTIVDDPTLENSYGYYLYDDEGVKARERVLYKNGLINEFLHNRETAKRMNIKSNGSARANSYSNEPIVRMANTFLKAGKSSEEELIKETKKGVYIKNFMEWNIDDKRYQQKYVGNEAYLIENGEITKPVRNPALELTTPKLWSSIDLIANNLKLFAGTCGKGEPMQGIPVLMGGPSIRLRNIKLS